jgi:uncharacterized protein (TIGR00297 family)
MGSRHHYRGVAIVSVRCCPRHPTLLTGSRFAYSNHPGVVRVVAGGLLSAGVAFAAHRRAALTVSGAWAAAIVGTLLVLAGWRWLVLVGVFFVTSSILTHLKGRRRSGDTTGRRWQQVAANGGIAALAAVAYASTGWPPAFAVAAGSIAAATADTWATEVGRWTRAVPRLITTGRPVPPGTSGGVTVLGTAATVCGALLIAAVALVLDRATMRHGTAWAIWIAVAGVSGSLFDSLLGATIEERVRWLDNDAVNVAATAWGAAVMLCAASPQAFR